MVFAGDNRGLSPFADTSASRVQLIIDLNDISASRAYVSQTCLLGHIACRPPLGPQHNSFTVQAQAGTYTIVYSFRQSIVPQVVPIPTIAGSLTFTLNSNGWAQAEGAWKHSAFPSAAMWHMRYGIHNRRLMAVDVDTDCESFKNFKCEETYATVPIN